jgi:hypothetical protein
MTVGVWARAGSFCRSGAPESNFESSDSRDCIALFEQFLNSSSPDPTFTQAAEFRSRLAARTDHNLCQRSTLYLIVGAFLPSRRPE